MLFIDIFLSLFRMVRICEKLQLSTWICAVQSVPQNWSFLTSEVDNNSAMAVGSQEEALKRMSKLVNSLLARNDCGPFREPVDWRGLELYDYPKIIKKMMDLGTVKRKLERKQYATAHECAEDIRLIWKNCWTYNADGSDFWLLAKSFSRRFEDRYRKIKTEFDVGEIDETAPKSNNTLEHPAGSKESSLAQSKVTLDAKALLASKVFLLSGVELARVIQKIENSAPGALQASGNDAEIEINIDGLDHKTFSEIDEFVREKVSKRHSVQDSPIELKPTGPSGAGSQNKKRKK